MDGCVDRSVCLAVWIVVNLMKMRLGDDFGVCIVLDLVVNEKIWRNENYFLWNFFFLSIDEGHV